MKTKRQPFRKCKECTLCDIDEELEQGGRKVPTWNYAECGTHGSFHGSEQPEDVSPIVHGDLCCEGIEEYYNAALAEVSELVQKHIREAGEYSFPGLDRTPALTAAITIAKEAQMRLWNPKK